jgi:hypothetical protein
MSTVHSLVWVDPAAQRRPAPFERVDMDLIDDAERYDAVRARRRDRPALFVRLGRQERQ